MISEKFTWKLKKLIDELPEGSDEQALLGATVVLMHELNPEQLQGLAQLTVEAALRVDASKNHENYLAPLKRAGHG